MHFEQARFSLVCALSNVEAKKRFEFLESVGEAMDAHLCYFKQGYELLHQMEPSIHQVLLNAQKSRESYYSERHSLNERIQEFKRHIDFGNKTSCNLPAGNGDLPLQQSRSSHKSIQAVMQSASEGKVQTIKQGYLCKRSSNLRGDWKRRFFVLDNRGMLYYYRKQLSRPSGTGSQRGNPAAARFRPRNSQAVTTAADFADSVEVQPKDRFLQIKKSSKQSRFSRTKTEFCGQMLELSKAIRDYHDATGFVRMVIKLIYQRKTQRAFIYVAETL